MTIHEERGAASPALILAAGAFLIGFATSRLVDVSVGGTSEPGPEARVQPVEAMRAAPLDGVVTVNHPVLPERSRRWPMYRSW